MSRRHEMAISLLVWAGALAGLLVGLLLSRGAALAVTSSVGAAAIALAVMADHRGVRTDEPR